MSATPSRRQQQAEKEGRPCYKGFHACGRERALQHDTGVASTTIMCAVFFSSHESTAIHAMCVTRCCWHVRTNNRHRIMMFIRFSHHGQAVCRPRYRSHGHRRGHESAGASQQAHHHGEDTREHDFGVLRDKVDKVVGKAGCGCCSQCE